MAIGKTYLFVYLFILHRSPKTSKASCHLSFWYHVPHFGGISPFHNVSILDACGDASFEFHRANACWHEIRGCISLRSLWYNYSLNHRLWNRKWLENMWMRAECIISRHCNDCLIHGRVIEPVPSSYSTCNCNTLFSLGLVELAFSLRLIWSGPAHNSMQVKFWDQYSVFQKLIFFF